MYSLRVHIKVPPHYMYYIILIHDCLEKDMSFRSRARVTGNNSVRGQRYEENPLFHGSGASVNKIAHMKAKECSHLN